MIWRRACVSRPAPHVCRSTAHSAPPGPHHCLAGRLGGEGFQAGAACLRVVPEGHSPEMQELEHQHGSVGVEGEQAGLQPLVRASARAGVVWGCFLLRSHSTPPESEGAFRSVASPAEKVRTPVPFALVRESRACGASTGGSPRSHRGATWSLLEFGDCSHV